MPAAASSCVMIAMLVRSISAGRAADVPAIAAMGRKGGSNVAAAICNALLYTAVDALDPARRGWQG